MCNQTYLKGCAHGLYNTICWTCNCALCILSFSFNFVSFLIFGVAGLLPALVTLLVLFYSHRRIFAAWCLWEIKGYYSACFLLLLIQELCVIVHRTIILFWPKKGNKIMFWMFLLLLLFWIFFFYCFFYFILFYIHFCLFDSCFPALLTEMWTVPFTPATQP